MMCSPFFGFSHFYLREHEPSLKFHIAKKKIPFVDESGKRLERFFTYLTSFVTNNVTIFSNTEQISWCSVEFINRILQLNKSEC